MTRLRVAVFVPLAALGVGALVGFFNAEGQHIKDNPQFFFGSWLGGALSYSVMAALPALAVCWLWNAVAARVSKRNSGIETPGT